MMTKAELLQALEKAANTQYPASTGGSFDQEMAHVYADEALIAFINDPEVTAAYEAIPKWYA